MPGGMVGENPVPYLIPPDPVALLVAGGLLSAGVRAR